MKLMKKINEDGADGAMGGGDIGVAAMPLFSTFVRRSQSEKQPAPKIIKYKKGTPVPKKFSLGLKEATKSLFEADPTTPTPDFDTTEVIAKLKSLENSQRQDRRDTVTFGLDDDESGLVRVTVRGEQAEDFEKSLQALLSNGEDDELPEIAEILYKLKDQFDIVDVEWPEVEEDEEVDQSLSGDTDPSADPNAPAGMDGDNADMDLDMGAPDDTADSSGGGAQDMLMQVIDMMKADAEARKADAHAREAEAKNREAEAAIGQAHSRVKQEEELLDMDTYNKTQKEEAKEAKRLAQLAQWKNDVGNNHGNEEKDDFGLGQSVRGQEEEEITRKPQQLPKQQPKKGSTVGGRVHPHDIARFILNRMR